MRSMISRRKPEELVKLPLHMIAATCTPRCTPIQLHPVYLRSLPELWTKFTVESTVYLVLVQTATSTAQKEQVCSPESVQVESDQFARASAL